MIWDDLCSKKTKDNKKATLCDHLWCLIPFYNTLQCFLSLLQPFLTFSDAFGPFATFLDFTLFNTLPDCVAFSGTFHQTLFTWLVHHSFSFSGIILVRSALRSTDISCFILLLQLYLWFLLPPLPNRMKSSPFNCTTVYWPQISLRLLLLSFSLIFLVYCTDHCHFFLELCRTISMDLSLTWMTFSDHFWVPIIILTHSFSPLSTARDRLPSPRTFSLILWCL